MLSPLEAFTEKAPFSWYAVPRAPAVFHLGMRRGTEDARGISIVDQLQLAAFFIQEATRAGVIGPDFPVLIYGAGAAGISAAMVAEENKVRSTVREQSNQTLAPQARSATRWLHPHQYDWPEASWLKTTFAGVGSGLLSWRPDYAPAVAAQLTEQFSAATKTGTISFRPNTTLSVLPARRAAWDALPEPEKRRLYVERYRTFIANEDPTQQFALYLICTGFGLEKCSLPPFTGFRFWSADPIPQPSFGSKIEQAQILISGGGDGAQQDLLRLAYSITPAEILSRFAKAAESCREGADWQNQIASKVAQIEKSEYELRRAGSAYDNLVNAILPAPWDAIKRAIATMLRPEFLNSKLTFVFPKSHLPKCFPLNRLLTLMLRRYLLEDRGTDIFAQSTSIGGSAHPNPPHACNESAEDCWALPHTVELRKPTGIELVRFDIIIIRHGLLPL